MSVFLRAEWRKLAMANYAVEPSVLTPYLPVGTQLDLWNNTCYVSLVGFMFLNTRLKGIKVPFHTNFEEVNLRFYVKRRTSSGIKRGVVFVKEFVPKPALTFIANAIYQEHYQTVPMKHLMENESAKRIIKVAYKWKLRDWNSFGVIADSTPIDITEGSEEEFITEHYWGYTKTGAARTSEYAVEHPRWRVYLVKDYSLDVDFGSLYGKTFDFLGNQKPVSVFLAEGSEIIVREASSFQADPAPILEPIISEQNR